MLFKPPSHAVFIYGVSRKQKIFLFHQTLNQSIAQWSYSQIVPDTWQALGKYLFYKQSGLGMWLDGRLHVSHIRGFDFDPQIQIDLHTQRSNKWMDKLFIKSFRNHIIQSRFVLLPRFLPFLPHRWKVLHHFPNCLFPNVLMCYFECY